MRVLQFVLITTVVAVVFGAEPPAKCGKPAEALKKLKQAETKLTAGKAKADKVMKKYKDAAEDGTSAEPAEKSSRKKREVDSSEADKEILKDIDERTANMGKTIRETRKKARTDMNVENMRKKIDEKLEKIQKTAHDQMVKERPEMADVVKDKFADAYTKMKEMRDKTEGMMSGDSLDAARKAAQDGLDKLKESGVTGDQLRQAEEAVDSMKRAAATGEAAVTEIVDLTEVNAEIEKLPSEKKTKLRKAIDEGMGDKDEIMDIVMDNPVLAKKLDEAGPKALEKAAEEGVINHEEVASLSADAEAGFECGKAIARSKAKMLGTAGDFKATASEVRGRSEAMKELNKEKDERAKVVKEAMDELRQEMGKKVDKAKSGAQAGSADAEMSSDELREKMKDMTPEELVKYQQKMASKLGDMSAEDRKKYEDMAKEMAGGMDMSGMMDQARDGMTDEQKKLLDQAATRTKRSTSDSIEDAADKTSEAADEMDTAMSAADDVANQIEDGMEELDNLKEEAGNADGGVDRVVATGVALALAVISIALV